MPDFDGLQHAMRYGDDPWTVPRWARGALHEVIEGRLHVAAIRHPLGFVCIPIERTGERGVCVHVWSDRLATAQPTTSPIHAHSWRLVSYVLYGTVHNELFGVHDVCDEPEYRLFRIVSVGDVDEMRETPRLVRAHIDSTESVRRGGVYSMPAGVFHNTVVQGDAATVALGSGQPECIDLSLGGLTTTTHRVRRQRCDPDETVRAARVAAERLGPIPSVDQEDRWDRCHR